MKYKHQPAKYQISLKALVKNEQGEYLILKSLSNSPHFAGYYDLPGGRINQEETKINFHQIIIREIKEEVGPIKHQLKPNPVSLSQYYYPNNDKILYILFQTKYIKGKIKISHEHTAYRWQKLNKNSIKKFFHPALQQLMINYLKWNKK
jgi:8-oxo-dGTP diphosphatase